MDNEEYEDEGSLLDQQEEQQRLELEQLQAQQAEMEAQQKAQEKLLKTQLRQVLRSVGVTKMALNPQQKRTVKQAKQFPNLKNDIRAINSMLSANKVKNAMKGISSLPLLKFFIVFGLLLFLFISVLAIFSALTGDGGEEPSAQFGIKGADFYGARMVYADDEKATEQMVEDYVLLVENSIDEVEKVSDVTVSGVTYNLTLNINILLPEDDYNYSTFNETTFSTEYSTLYEIIKEVAEIVYLADNGTAYSGSTLVDCLNGITYFGFANLPEVTATLAEDISQVTNITSVKDGAGNDATLTTEIQNAFINQVQTNLTSVDFQNKHSVRTAKLFVKDYILTEDSEMISKIKKQNYVAMIFMPKKDVSFTKLSFQISNTNFENFTISITANGIEIPIETDGANVSLNEKEAYIYSTSSNLNISAQEFADIDKTNLNALSEDISLLEIVKSFDDYSPYLETKTDENSIDFLTIKQNGVVVNLGNSETFNIVEWETLWS